MTQDNDQGIVHLEGVDAVRKRPGMFINGSTEAGVRQICWEILDNAVDEFLSGNCQRIDVEIDTAKNRMVVKDWGRGIPNTIHSKTEQSIITSIFTYLHMGGKFGTGLYKYSSGLHGVGAVCTNALASDFRVETWHNGKGFRQAFQQGVATTPSPSKSPKRPKSGWSTRISFVPDPEIFKDGIDKLDTVAIREHIANLRYMCKGLKLVFRLDGKTDFFEAKGGLVDYIKDTLTEKDLKSYLGKIFHFKDSAQHIEVALSWSDYDGEWVDQYINTVNTQDGGRPAIGLRKAVAHAFSKVQSKKVTPGDLRWGMGAVMSIMEEHPQFKGQTKDELINPEWEKKAYDLLVPPLIKFLNDNPNLTTTVVNRAAKLGKIKQQFAQEKDAMRAIKTAGNNIRGGLPPKLITTTRKCEPADKELYLVEGESAEGTVKRARADNGAFQEVLGLKGKFTNAARFGLAKVMSNQDVSNIVASIGAGLERSGGRCDPKRSRVGKVILLMDADPDGRHIDCLSLVLLMKYMRPLVDAGMIYVIDSPLYQASETNGKKHFGYTLQEVQANSTAKAIVTRLKGWGEINAEDLAPLALEPLTRRMFQITTDKNSQTVETLMGSDATVRKELLGLA